MNPAQPSRTALAAAHHRATHQITESGLIFQDRLALRLIGANPAQLSAEAAARPEQRGMRIFVCARARFAEDTLRAAVSQGATQLIILGAGLDSFAYRSPYGDALRVFEIDHPATQAWKRQMLAAAGIAAPPWLTYAATDFEGAPLAETLAQCGLNPTQHSVFLWLGVMPYLTQPAIHATLATIAATPHATLVFDYGEPPETLPPETRALHETRARQVADLGEPWISHFEPGALASLLRGHGFTTIADLDIGALGARYFAEWPIRTRRAGHVVRVEK